MKLPLHPLALLALLPSLTAHADPWAGVWLHHGSLEVESWNRGRCVSVSFVEDRVLIDVLDAGFGAYDGLYRSLETVRLVHAPNGDCVLPTLAGPFGGAQRLWQLSGKATSEASAAPRLAVAGTRGRCDGPACRSPRLPTLRFELEAREDRLVAHRDGSEPAAHWPERRLLSWSRDATEAVKPALASAGRACGELWELGTPGFQKKFPREELVRHCERKNRQLGPIKVRRAPIGHFFPTATGAGEGARLLVESRIDRQLSGEAQEIFVFVHVRGKWRLQEYWSLD
jgi:hypothetical protein